VEELLPFIIRTRTILSHAAPLQFRSIERFNEAVGSPDYMVSNFVMINEQLFENNIEGRGRGPLFLGVALLHCQYRIFSNSRMIWKLPGKKALLLVRITISSFPCRNWWKF
jgi:hypothetical protein